MDIVHSYLSCFFSLAVTRTSQCYETSIGHKFEVFNITISGNVYSMVPDLAIPGNILVSTMPQDKLYTTDMLTVKELTTESELNLTSMPPFLQTGLAGDFVCVVSPWYNGFSKNSLRFCHLSRDLKTCSAFYTSEVCESFCHANDRSLSYKITDIFHGAPRRPILIMLDERYGDLGYFIVDSYVARGVSFFNLSSIYKGKNSATTFFNMSLKFHSSYYIVSAVQDGDFTYLVNGPGIYRMDMPSASGLQSGGNTELSVLWVSGGKKQNFHDADFVNAEYYWLNSIVRINSTMLAVADLDSNRIRLLDLKKNVTSSLCVTGVYNIDTQSTFNTCAIMKPSSLLFVNNSLYVGWAGGFGRIYHSAEKYQLSDNEEHETMDPYDIKSDVAVAIPIVILVIAAVVAVTILMWRRNNSSSRTRSRPESEGPEVCERVNRPLPSISAGLEASVDEGESYDMPEMDQEDVYDMIGDQYYQTLDLRREPITTYEAATRETDMTGSDDPHSIPDSNCYADRLHTEQSYSSSMERNEVCDSNLDKYGYLKPTPTSDRLTL